MLDKMSLNMCELCTSLYLNTPKNFIEVSSDSPFQLHHNWNVDNTNIMIFKYEYYKMGLYGNSDLSLLVNLCQNMK